MARQRPPADLRLPDPHRADRRGPGGLARRADRLPRAGDAHLRVRRPAAGGLRGAHRHPRHPRRPGRRRAGEGDHRSQAALPGLQRPFVPAAGDHRPPPRPDRRLRRRADQPGPLRRRAGRRSGCWAGDHRRRSCCRPSGRFHRRRAPPDARPRPPRRVDPQRHALRAAGPLAQGLRPGQERRPRPPRGGGRVARHRRRHPALLPRPRPRRDRGAGGGLGGGLGDPVPTPRVRHLPGHRRRALQPQPLGAVRDRPPLAARQRPRRRGARRGGRPPGLRPLRHPDGHPLLGAVPRHRGRLRPRPAGGHRAGHLRRRRRRHGPPLPGARRRPRGGRPAAQAGGVDGDPQDGDGLPARRRRGVALLRAVGAGQRRAAGGDRAGPPRRRPLRLDAQPSRPRAGPPRRGARRRRPGGGRDPGAWR